MWTADNTIPELVHKSLDIRKLFAEVANASLSKGRSNSEAVNAGVMAVSHKERSNLPNKLPPLPKLPVNASEIIKKAAELKKVSQEVVSSTFDDKGRLILVYKDGRKIVSDKGVNTTLVEQNIKIAPSTAQVDYPPGTDNPFSDENELNRSFTFVSGKLTRIDYASGNYKLFTYSGERLDQIDYIKGATTYRKVFNYDVSGNILSISHTII